MGFASDANTASALLERIKEHIERPVFEVSLGSGEVTWASDAARGFWGFDGPLEGRPLREIINERDCKSLLRELERSSVDGARVSLIVRAICAKGERTARVSAAGYFVGGEARALLSFGEASYQSEYYEQLQRDNDDLKRLVSNVPCGFFSYDIDAGSTFVSVSAGLLDIFGYTEGEFRRVFANKYFNMIYEADRDSAKLTVFEQLAKRSRSDLAYRVRRADGALRWLYEKGHLVVEPDGSQVFYVAVLDATELYSTRESLRATTLELEAIAANVPCALAMLEVGGEVKISFANDRYYELFGSTRERAGSRLLLREHMSARDYDSFCDMCCATAGSREPFGMEFSLKKPDGALMWLECVSRVFDVSAEGNPLVVAMISDVTDRKRHELELAVQAERSRLIAEVTDEKIFEYDPVSDMMSLPPVSKGAKLTVIRSFRVMANRRDGGGNGEGSVAKAIDYMLEHPDGVTVEFRTDYFTRELEWFRAAYHTVLDDSGAPARIVGRLINITSERIEHDQLMSKACADPLTSLLNRAALRARTEAFLSRDGKDGSHAAIVIDIDNFKAVNDAYGHPFGDAVISEVARHLGDTFRTSDYLGRIGGDEFMAFIKNVDRVTAVKKAGELLDRLSGITHPSGTLRLTASVGVAVFPEDAGSYMRLYLKADMALYEAKRSGKNAVVAYDKSMDDESNYNPPSG